MRRLIVTELGTPPVASIAEEPDPVAGPGHVVLEVGACGIGFVDALVAAGEYQIKVPAPFTPAGEIAGTVAQVGEEVTGLAVGDRVAGYLGLGGLASHMAAPAAALAPIPGDVSDVMAASIGSAYVTALFALTDRVQVREGQTVLVLGAGGGMGLAAVDVARARGATVVAAASTPEKRAAAEAAGASVLIDYEQEDLRDRLRGLPGRGVDLIYDPVGGEHSFQAFRGLKPEGTHLVVGFTAGDIPSFPLNRILLQNRAVVGVDLGHRMGTDRGLSGRLLRQALAEVADGTLRPVEPTVFPLEEAVDALVALRGRELTGKAVIDLTA
jgi:NADPH2:quinone reductase